MITGQALADIDIDAAMQLYQAKCQVCHGDAGNATTTSFPKLAGQQPTYLKKTLDDYQRGANGPRFNPIMTPIAAPLSTTDITNLTAYLSTQTATGGEAQPNLLALGEKLYRAGDQESHIPACAACHGPSGAGNLEATYPKLAGQNSAYITQQLQLFANGQRHSDPHGMMRDIAKRLSPDDAAAVASFIQGLRP